MKYLNHKIYICIIILLSAQSQSFAKNNYPKTIEEQESDEMGSILESGITWAPKKVKSDSTKATMDSNNNVNKYLWKASLEELRNFPIISADVTSGLIITDWYIDNNDQNRRVKFNIFIKANIISSESIEVRIFEEKLVQNKWVDDKNNKAFVSLEENILRKARDLYQLEQKNK